MAFINVVAIVHGHYLKTSLFIYSLFILHVQLSYFPCQIEDILFSVIKPYEVIHTKLILCLMSPAHIGKGEIVV